MTEPNSGHINSPFTLIIVCTYLLVSLSLPVSLHPCLPPSLCFLIPPPGCRYLLGVSLVVTQRLPVDVILGDMN